MNKLISFQSSSRPEPRSLRSYFNIHTCFKRLSIYNWFEVGSQKPSFYIDVLHELHCQEYITRKKGFYVKECSVSCTSDNNDIYAQYSNTSFLENGKFAITIKAAKLFVRIIGLRPPLFARDQVKESWSWILLKQWSFSQTIFPTLYNFQIDFQNKTRQAKTRLQAILLAVQIFHLPLRLVAIELPVTQLMSVMLPTTSRHTYRSTPN